MCCLQRLKNWEARERKKAREHEKERDREEERKSEEVGAIKAIYIHLNFMREKMLRAWSLIYSFVFCVLKKCILYASL